MVKSALAFIEITQHPDDSLQSNEVLTHLCRCPVASKMRYCMISTPFQGKKGPNRHLSSYKWLSLNYYISNDVHDN